MVDMLYLTCEKEADGPLERSSHFFTTQHHRSGQRGCLITLDHFERSICTARHVGLCADSRSDSQEGYTLRLIRADICPISMDTIAVEVAWSGRHHWGRRR